MSTEHESKQRLKNLHAVESIFRKYPKIDSPYGLLGTVASIIKGEKIYRIKNSLHIDDLPLFVRSECITLVGDNNYPIMIIKGSTFRTIMNKGIDTFLKELRERV
jgi:hypothetical protein